MKVNIFQYEFPDMLIKVSSKKEYLEDLCAGKIYMNESGYFRKLEDAYRGDKFDGRCLISFHNHLGEFLEFGPEDEPEQRIKISLDAIKDFTVGFSGDDKIPLYCCSQLSEAILYQETETSIRFRNEFVSEMEKFGGYYVLFNKSEFLQNMLGYIEEKHLGGKWGTVSYVDLKSEYSIELLNDNSRNQYDSFFKKDLSYRWQNEWRILLTSNDLPLIIERNHHYIATIKPLSWFHIGDVSELRTNAIEIRKMDETELGEDLSKE